jgi:hypothetical protein
LRFCCRISLLHADGGKYISRLPRAWYMFCPYDPHYFHHPNNTWRGVLVLELLLTQASPALPFRSRYSHQHPFLRHLQRTFFQYYERLASSLVFGMC